MTCFVQENASLFERVFVQRKFLHCSYFYRSNENQSLLLREQQQKETEPFSSCSGVESLTSEKWEEKGGRKTWAAFF